METIELFFGNYKAPFTILHVLAVVFGMGAALVSDFLFNFYTKDKELSKTEISTLSILSKIVLTALPLIILSGVALFLGNIDKYLSSAKFLVKMTLMVILLINGFILDKYIWSHLINKKFFTSPKERKFRMLSFICGATSAITWLFICGLGVLDSVPLSYWQLLGVYTVLLFGTFPIALAIEFKEFEKK
jgi:hypothetical protein